MNQDVRPETLTGCQPGDTYRSTLFGEWVYSEPSPENHNCGEWRQRRQPPNTTVELEVRLLALRGDGPEFMQLAWSGHIVEKYRHFSFVFVQWGPVLLEKLGAPLPPRRRRNQPEFGERLELTSVILPSECFTPYMAYEYQVFAIDPIVPDIEFCATWRALEPVGVEAQDKKSPDKVAKIWLSHGVPVEENLRRISDWEDFEARR